MVIGGVIYSIFRDGEWGNNGGLVGIELYNAFVTPNTVPLLLPLQRLSYSTRVPLSAGDAVKRRLNTAMSSEPGMDCIYRNAPSDTAAE